MKATKKKIPSSTKPPASSAIEKRSLNHAHDTAFTAKRAAGGEATPQADADGESDRGDGTVAPFMVKPVTRTASTKMPTATVRRRRKSPAPPPPMMTASDDPRLVPVSFSVVAAPPVCSPRVLEVAAMFGLGVDEARTMTIVPPCKIPLPMPGIVFITGPSGSGKSTILRLIVQRLRERGERVIEMNALKVNAPNENARDVDDLDDRAPDIDALGRAHSARTHAGRSRA